MTRIPSARPILMSALVLNVISFVSVGGAINAAEPNSESKISVMLVDGQNNHDWLRCGPVMIHTLEATGRFEVEQFSVTKEDIPDFKPDFTRFDVVLSNYNGKPWLEETKTAFVKYIRC